MKYQFFSADELKCQCGKCGPHKMQHDFMQKLERLREAAGFPFVLNSAYRCPTHNDNVSSTGLDGPHTTGRAVDIRCHGRRAFDLVRLAQAHGFTGIGVSQRGVHGARFIHLDDLPDALGQPRPWIWTY